ncbi:hypothetical protein B0H67DRAFT_145416 [Lasiosphaeris hirsuta]|uniref:Uncharacterized protein n=1 Tax=Lasiosphaeris hirsuta TaxID=260670 RepID=A0AA40B1Q9_9PEZI|nr:hypothetical protein B0H67DRAFT_145416 [Lasiosphaeris hirsuta]
MDLRMQGGGGGRPFGSRSIRRRNPQVARQSRQSRSPCAGCARCGVRGALRSSAMELEIPTATVPSDWWPSIQGLCPAAERCRKAVVLVTMASGHWLVAISTISRVRARLTEVISPCGRPIAKLSTLLLVLHCERPLRRHDLTGPSPTRRSHCGQRSEIATRLEASFATKPGSIAFNVLDPRPCNLSGSIHVWVVCEGKHAHDRRQPKHSDPGSCCAEPKV